jgi:hypothetical protein
LGTPETLSPRILETTRNGTNDRNATLNASIPVSISLWSRCIPVFQLSENNLSHGNARGILDAEISEHSA